MLTDATRRQLQQLRFLLEEALNRSQEQTVIGRHSALVLLDGACEYAMALALGHRSLRIHHVFATKYDDLRVGLPEWNPDTWTSIRELHETRNLAQHHGVVADPSYLPTLSAQAQRFVRSLIEAAFGVELETVRVAGAIESEEIRRLLLTAEEALADGDAGSAFAAAVEGFDVARAMWRGQRAEAIGEVSLQYSGSYRPDGADEIDPVNRSVLRFEDLLEVQPFAPDIAEYHWLVARRGEYVENVPLKLDTARRAFEFVVAWVLRWEAFAVRYEARRYAPPPAPYTPPTTGGDHPVIHDFSVEVQHRLGSWIDQPSRDNVRYQATVILADVPEGDRELWSLKVHEALNEFTTQRGFDHIAAANVDTGGIVRFYGVSAHVAGSELCGWVEAALIEGDRRWQDEVVAREARASRVPAVKANFERELGTVDTRELVDGVAWEAREDGTDWIRVLLRRDADDPMLGHVLDQVAQKARSGVDGVEYFVSGLAFTIDFDPGAAAALVASVAAEYDAQAVAWRAGLEAIEDRRRALEEELRSAALSPAE